MGWPRGMPGAMMAGTPFGLGRTNFIGSCAGLPPAFLSVMIFLRGPNGSDSGVRHPPCLVRSVFWPGVRGEWARGQEGSRGHGGSCVCRWGRGSRKV